ncbi:MAG: hypothetical protein PHP23_14175 [Desulfobacterales bacterium]|nr:hypothetical protein [Desulfobacterales bacterium]MDD4072353.1 hypothetical protein [Desulfobacterales bacterium]MDD4393025.1 hypothetical protein [Desulfobacterales bacterium]
MKNTGVFTLSDVAVTDKTRTPSNNFNRSGSERIDVCRLEAAGLISAEISSGVDAQKNKSDSDGN